MGGLGQETQELPETAGSLWGFRNSSSFVLLITRTIILSLAKSYNQPKIAPSWLEKAPLPHGMLCQGHPLESSGVGL